MIIDKKVGLKLIREYGLENFQDDSFVYHTTGGGIIAVKDSKLDGKEIHLAFKKEFRPGAREFIINFCNELNCVVWAFIEAEYRTTVNMAYKCGFEYEGLRKGVRLDDTTTMVHIMKRAKQ